LSGSNILAAAPSETEQQCKECMRDTHTHTHTLTHTHTHTHTHAKTHMHTHIHTHAKTHMHTHTFTPLSLSHTPNYHTQNCDEDEDMMLLTPIAPTTQQ